MRKTQNVVKRVLTNYPNTRDNDSALIMLTLIDLGLYQNISLSDYLTEEQKNYPSFETITRCRRLLQTIYPELRGDKWKDRHDYSYDFKGQVKEIRDSELEIAKESYVNGKF